VFASDGPEIASPEEVKGQWSMFSQPLVLDVRDLDERLDENNPIVKGSVNVPLNMDGAKQSERATTLEEFRTKLEQAAVLPKDKDKAIITHCGSGGRGAKAMDFLEEMGYTNVINGGSASRINAALEEKDISGRGTADAAPSSDEDEQGSDGELALLIVGTLVGTVVLLGVITAFL